MSESLVVTEQHGHVAVLRLNRPDRLNALNYELGEALHAALDAVEAAWPQTRALVLIGAGRAFCAGGDVGQIKDAAGGVPAMPYGREIRDLPLHLRGIPQPVIAAVNGAAVGAGLSLACASDVRIASQDARFGCVFVKRSMVPDTGCSYTLARIVGPGIAAEMALTGRIYDARWAREVKLVNSVVSADALLVEALALAQEIAANPPITVRSVKKLMDSFWLDLSGVTTAEREFNRQSEGTLDRKEAAAAFLEKRAPVYVGR
jgi:2-(1,2-epoxy-1,2-dihydrophenyl)acetyl-CoA isomerase